MKPTQCRERFCTEPATAERRMCRDHLREYRKRTNAAYAANYDHILERIEYVGECHVWTGQLNPHGKPTIGRVRVRRFLWRKAHGKLAADDIVKRGCKTEGCVRLEHMRLGSDETKRTYPRVCLKCDKPFDATHPKANRLCDTCRGVNASIAWGIDG